MFNTTFWTIMEITLPKDETIVMLNVVASNLIQHLLCRGDSESSSE